MKLINKFWTSVKRNPVINAFLVAVATQVFQDWTRGTIDFANILGYASMVCLSVMARMFTVPLREHEDTVENLHQEIDKRGRW